MSLATGAHLNQQVRKITLEGWLQMFKTFYKLNDFILKAFYGLQELRNEFKNNLFGCKNYFEQQIQVEDL